MMEIARAIVGNGAILFVFPYMIGTLLLREDEPDAFVRSYVYGWIGMMAAFEAVYLPAYFLGLSFSDMCSCFSAALAMLMILALTRKNYRSHALPFLEKLYKGFSWQTGVILGIAAVELFFVSFFTNIANYSPGDDAYHISCSADAIHTDKIWYLDGWHGYPWGRWFSEGASWKRVITGWDMFVAYGAKTLGEEVVVFAYNGLAIALILLFYGVLYLVARRLFADAKEAKLFYMLAMIAVLFAYPEGSYWSQGMLARPWQGRSVFFGILFPLLFLFVERLLGASEEGRQRSRDTLLLALVNVAAVCVTTMAIPLFVGCTLFCCGAYGFYHRKQLGLFLPRCGAAMLSLAPEGLALLFILQRGSR